MRVNYWAILCLILLMMGYQSSLWSMDSHEAYCPEVSAQKIKMSLRCSGCELMEHSAHMKCQQFEDHAPLGPLKTRVAQQWQAILQDMATEGKEARWLLCLENQNVISPLERERMRELYVTYCQKWATLKDESCFQTVRFLKGFLGKDTDEEEEDNYELAEMYFPFLFEEWQQFRISHGASLQQDLEKVTSTLSSSKALQDLVKRSYVVFF